MLLTALEDMRVLKPALTLHTCTVPCVRPANGISLLFAGISKPQFAVRLLWNNYGGISSLELPIENSTINGPRWLARVRGRYRRTGA